MKVEEAKWKSQPYSGYRRTAIPTENELLTHSGPGTVLGEYMRRFWQPVAMSNQLVNVPVKVRIMGEDLIAFRDKGGRVGLLHNKCIHRGASLEFGVIQDEGIRCCYHGIQFDVDGTILSAPLEPDGGQAIKRRLTQPAYPVFELHGLVFAYMGPAEEKPPFPTWDAFDVSDGRELVPFSNIFPCNWLQVMDNIADQMHTYVLHNPPFLYGEGAAPEGWEGVALANCQSTVPVMDYVESRNGTAMTLIAGRRMDPDTVWWRINDLIVPNMSQHAYLFEDGSTSRAFHRVSMSRWYVPIDDRSSMILGWRMFGGDSDPLEKGRREKVGWDDMDFLEGQTGNRPFEIAQALPGDYEAIVAQGPIAIHAYENPLSSDAGVYLYRRLLNKAISGTNEHASPRSMHSRAMNGQENYCYTQNNVLKIPMLDNKEEDDALIKAIGRQIIDLTMQADDLKPAERENYVRERIEAIEKHYRYSSVPTFSH